MPTFALTTQGVVLEWLKRHAWKACIRQKRIGGSNPPHSALEKRHYCLFFINHCNILSAT